MDRQRLKKGELRQINWNNLVIDLINNCEKYHEQFYSFNNFTGPSHHFHLRALAANGLEKAEMSYALLVSWGMHRMGGGAQMNDYNTFSESISACLDIIQSLKGKKLANILDSEFNSFQQIFDTLNPMKSSKKIVAVSKVLAHYLPDLVAPIDNEYTFRFICETPSQNIPPRNWKEFDLFRDIHINLFKPVVSNHKFNSLVTKWSTREEFHWDTSLPKIVDNLIIGKIRHLKKTDNIYKKVKKKNAR